MSAFTRVFDALWRASKDARPQRLGRRPSRLAARAPQGDGITMVYSGLQADGGAAELQAGAYDPGLGSHRFRDAVPDRRQCRGHYIAALSPVLTAGLAMLA